MPSDVQAIAQLLPDVDPSAVVRHLDRLDDEYVERFDTAQIAEHVSALSQLSHDDPVRVLLSRQDDGLITCVVIAFDHRFEFSLITGVLASVGFQIDKGDVFTLRPAAPKQPAQGRPRQGRAPIKTWRKPKRDPHRRAKIVDAFEGRQADKNEPYEAFAETLRSRLCEVIVLLEQKDEQATRKAQRLVNEWVTRRLAGLSVAKTSAMEEVTLDVDRDVDGRTRLHIAGQDTPAFLYSLSTALSLHNLSIERVRISGDGDMVQDTIDIVEADGSPIVDRDKLERVRLSILLTKQFTYFLDSAPDPFAALSRFEQLTEQIVGQTGGEQWRDTLSNPRAMQDLAKLLGASDYLWEDFIRQQADSLVPVLAATGAGQAYSEPIELLPLRLEQALDGAVGIAQQQDRLNRFKDDAIFRLDLDHILNPVVDFKEFSTRLTLLAENLIAAATRLVYEDLVKSYGQPSDKQGNVIPHAVFGLGKLGGVALGYASDIELLFVHGTSEGKTAGGKRDAVSNTEFFRTLTQETSQFIRAKRAGIFEVDLRLRPYGKEGPLACSRRQFQQYYNPEGEAHPFERLALVRLRWIAGDPSLGFEIEKLRNAFVYDGPPIDLDMIWDVWVKQHEQKNEPGRVNAKYSPGALVDLEGTVQLLQVNHARVAPQLRTPRLSGAIEGLRRAGVVNAADYADLLGSYRFMRRLINALRMLRGNAADLFLPKADSDEYIHLARRVGYTRAGDRSSAEQLAEEFDSRTAAVRRFIEQQFGRPCPGT